MLQNLLKKQLNKKLAPAKISFNGPHKWDPQVNDPRLYQRIFTQGTLGLGEAYMEGWWDCQSLDQFFYRLLRNKINESVHFPFVAWRKWMAMLMNLQTTKRSLIVGKHHYDVGNDLYRQMLDPLMTYSCGYWRNAQNLSEAQTAKLRLVFDKLHLKAGMRILDIGCGWGGAARFAAQHYGVEVVGVSISREQVNLATAEKGDLPVEFRFQDYRDLEGRFDRAYSIGMFEHVGHKNYRAYLEKISSLLVDDGLFVLHTIGKNTSSVGNDPWVDRYIFPNGVLPSIKQISEHCENLFVIEDLHNFGPDYDTTLMVWHRNFIQAWPQLKDQYSPVFKRMWEYYLLSFAGVFRARELQLWQWVLSPGGLPSAYIAPR